MPLSREVLEIIVCPGCKGELIYKKDDDELRCENCRLIYHIDGDIPILLLDEAKKY